MKKILIVLGLFLVLSVDLVFAVLPVTNPKPITIGACNKADTNKDGSVNSLDLNVILDSWGTSGCNSGNRWCDRKDTNKDGFIGGMDYVNVLNNWGAYTGRPCFYRVI